MIINLNYCISKFLSSDKRSGDHLNLQINLQNSCHIVGAHQDSFNSGDNHSNLLKYNKKYNIYPDMSSVKK